MLLHNQIEQLPNYQDAVSSQLRKARKVDLVISYVQQSGVAGLVNIYRSLPAKSRKHFERDVDAYFNEKLEPTATNVRGNYDKKGKHTRSALGWCERLEFDSTEKELRLTA